MATQATRDLNYPDRITLLAVDQFGQSGHHLVMQIVVSAAEAKAGLAELLLRAEGGEEIIVTRNGEPVAKLGPIRPRAGGFLRDEVVTLDPDWWHEDPDLTETFGS
jgi:prevent-host-death family protein